MVPRITPVVPSGESFAMAHGPALSSALFVAYRSTIGRGHFMTKELQGYIEGLKKRRNKRLNLMPQ